MSEIRLVIKGYKVVISPGFVKIWVPSDSLTDRFRTVISSPESLVCSCPGYRFRQICRHTLEVADLISWPAPDEGKDGEVKDDDQSSRAPKPFGIGPSELPELSRRRGHVVVRGDQGSRPAHPPRRR